MAVTLTTSEQQIGGTLKFAGDNSYYYYFYSWYERLTSTTARIYFAFKTYGTGSETCSCSGATFHATLDGEEKTASSGSFTVYRRSFSAKYAEISFDVTYDTSTGTWANKSVRCWVTGGSGTYSGGGSLGSNGCASVGNTSDTVSLPAIDPAPSATISSITVLNSTSYQGQNVASYTQFRVAMSFGYAQQATLTLSGAGITTNYTVPVTKASSESFNYDFTVPASSSNYTLSFTLTAQNDTNSATATTTRSIKGYFLPTYDTSPSNSTYTIRCDSNGEPDSQGEYGRLYLTWSVATVYSTTPNTLQSCTVKLNGTTIAATSGSIANGYLDFIFPLAVNVQGNLEVTFTDRITSNVITSLVVPKSTMPLSMYQSGDSVGVSIGRMCTESGLWVYEQMHYKDPNSTSVYSIVIESGYLKASGSASPLALLTTREVTATISKAVNSTVSITAPTVADYTFVGWLNIQTYGWIASVYVGSNTATATVYVSGNSGTTTGTGTVRAYALYQRTNP